MEGGSQEEIAKALTAYQHFSKLNSIVVKESLAREGADTSMGAVVSAVAAKWRALTESEQAPYEEMAREDRERYDKEKAKLDAAYLRIQEEKRKQNSIIETETRMRNTTLHQSEVVAHKGEGRKKRELTEKEKEKITQKRQAKEADESAISAAHNELSKTRAEQAEARLKYLLSQSDIFSHFGAGKVLANSIDSEDAGKSDTAPAPTAATGSSKERRSKEKGGAKHRADLEGLDEEEAAIVGEEADDSAVATAAHGGVYLTKQPSSIVGGQLRPYQIEGLNWMIRLQENGINGILADEMGLGKTLQSISILAYMYEYKNISGPHLILLPKSTLSNWMNEFAHWCPSLRAVKFHGNKDERQHITDTVLLPTARAEDREWDVCITTYEVANLERSALAKFAWRYLIIDEAHRLKNEASQFSQTVRLFNTQYRLLLTGTPLQNNLHELWALLNFLLPDVFASSEQFDEWFNLDVDDTEAKERMINQLHKILRPFMLRRLKVDVEKSLPPKSETILFTGMSTVQKNLYRQILLRDIDTINGAGGNSNGSRTAILNIVMQLRKCCNHPYLFPGVEDRTQDPMGEHLYGNCGKMVLLHKLLGKLKERGHRVLIFSQMTRMLDILEDYMLMSGYAYCRIDGNTSYEEREDRIADYNAPGSDKFVFLLSTRAGGLGINLQTADTCILYDSDWNPQADLQAQDRCHRIGQTKPVMVYRLVTDDTVEVKVVERAQQKLKLDAMVVQHGRLQNADKKLSKQELLDALRFGADKIFRTKDSNSITDDDIELILEQGRKRTEELNEKLQTADKGDLYDFRLDGGMSSQIFEGKDYSDRTLREAELNGPEPFLFIDPGKRERKMVTSYNENAKPAREESTDKKVKLPRHLRLPKLEDWQFFSRQRLQELQDEEIQILEKMTESGNPPNANNMAKLVLLPQELMDEKTALLNEAFGDWTRGHYNAYIRACAKYGRSAYDKISKDVNKSSEEVERYSKVFWSKGPSTLGSTEWEKVVKQIEKGEKRLEEIDRLTAATARLISMFADPWEDLTFKHVGNQGRIFNAVEDRYLLCLTHLHGYGNWDKVRNSIRRCERFRFDYYLLSCSIDALGKRCETLMRSAERELMEMDKKRQAADAAPDGLSKPTMGLDKSRLSAGSESGNKQRLSELTAQIEAEAKRLAVIRSELQKARASSSYVPDVGTKDTPTATTKSGQSTESAKGAAKSGKDEKKATTGANGSGGGTGAAVANSSAVQRGPPSKPVPDGILPDLCRLIVKSGTDGIAKVVAQFYEMYPTLSKRKIEIKVNEIAAKEKRGNDTTKVWHINPEFEHFLYMESSGMADDDSSLAVQETKPATSKSSGSGAPSKKRGKADDDDANGGEDHPVKDKKPRASSEGSQSGNKRKSGEAASGASQPGKEPKKRRAFWFFVRENRAKYEDEIGVKDTSDGGEKDKLKDKLLKEWKELEDSKKEVYFKMEQDDLLRYESELKVFLAAGGVIQEEKGGASLGAAGAAVPSTPSSLDPRIKKRKKDT